jgi:predicted amidophosphoribosyltransferase
MTEERTCPNCGGTIEDSDTVCPHCGEPLVGG